MSTSTLPKRRTDELPVLDTAEALRVQLRSAIDTYESAEIAMLFLIREFNFDLTTLEEVLKGEGLNVSFSNVKYESIADFVGLDPFYKFEDAPTFHIYRSRIPTPLFKKIVEDIDDMVIQYGSPEQHVTEEATCRFFSPIFDRLVPMFSYTFRNLLESHIEGRFTTGGRIEYYFMSFGSISVLVIEIKHRIMSNRLNAIAQVIAECDACSWKNSHCSPSLVPVFGVLCDGSTFEFFKFQEDGNSYTFSRGCIPGDPRAFRIGLPISNPSLNPTLFLKELRIICETIFDIMLQAYVLSLEAFRDRSVERDKRFNPLRKSLTKWEDALKSARSASDKFRKADESRTNGHIEDANLITKEGIKDLASSVEAAPHLTTMVSIISAWDNEEMEKV